MWLRRASTALLLTATTAIPAVASGAQASAHDVRAQPRVVNGRDVTAAAFAARWSAIAAVTSSTSWGSTLCGGALIDARTVLTAAHCTLNPNGSQIAPASMSVVVGRRVATSGDGDRVPVQSVTRHPSFSRATMRNDIAVLRLARDPLVAAGALTLTSAADEWWWGAGSGRATGDDLTGPFIAGWGALSAGGASFPDALQEAKLPIAADSACRPATPPGQGSAFDPGTMICAGSPSTVPGNGIDACQGDSGGPLVVGDGSGSWRLVGLTSWGRDCGGSRYGVYARVGRYVDWIEPLRYSRSSSPLAPTSPPGAAPTQPPPAAAQPPAQPPAQPSPPTDEPVAPGAPSDPAASAVGPLVLAPGANHRPSIPAHVAYRLVGMRRVPLLTWRASTDDGRVVRYRVLDARSGRRLEIARTSATSIALRRLGPGRHVLRVQALDDRGLWSRPSRARVVTIA